MNLFEGIDNLHFLRPEVFVFIIPLAILFIGWRKKIINNDNLDSVIAPYLRKALLIQQSKSDSNKPAVLFCIVSLLIITAAAGPSYKLQATPFLQDQAATVLVVQVSESMTNQDIQPSRLQRAVQKIEDFLELRDGAAHALIAYSGSAHTVMPLTTDASAILFFARELTPEIMPNEGDEQQQALMLAQTLIEQSGQQGSVVWISDRQLNVTGSKVPILWLPMSANAQAFESGSNITLFKITADNSDVKNMARGVKAELNSPQNNEGQQWQDEGYWLTPLIAVLMLFWFRRGWMVKYE